MRLSIKFEKWTAMIQRKRGYHGTASQEIQW